jgi:hypothetical protein
LEALFQRLSSTALSLSRTWKEANIHQPQPSQCAETNMVTRYLQRARERESEREHGAWS